MNTLKKYSMAIVAVMMVIGFSAFKVVESFQSAPVNGWYELDISSNNPLDYNDPSKQKLTGTIHSNPEGATCKTDNDKKPCAIHLEFSEEYDGPIFDGSQSVADLANYSGVTMTIPSGSISFYSRRDTDSSL